MGWVEMRYVCVCACTCEASILSSPLDFCNLDGRDSVSRDRKRRRSASRGTRPLGFSFSWNASRTCTSEACYGAILSKGRATFSYARSLTYRAVKKTTGIHAQVQASRDTLDPQLTPGHGCSLKYRWKEEKSVRKVSFEYS